MNPNNANKDIIFLFITYHLISILSHEYSSFNSENNTYKSVFKHWQSSRFGVLYKCRKEIGYEETKKEFQTNRQTSLGTPQVNTRDNNSNISNHKEFGEMTSPLS